MAVRTHVKMDISNRAKQFMPFAALKGLPEALAKKEKMIVPKPQLSEDHFARLDYIMHQVRKGMIVAVTYYFQEECFKKTGIVAKVDAECRFIQIVDTKILFDHILDVEIIESLG